MIQLIQMARLGLLLLLCIAAPLARAGTDAPEAPSQQAGLMWNRSGLPAVFPLQVKTPPGRDYFMTLLDAKTGDAALAAYIEGGVFFRILVPPGAFALKFAAGNGWQGEEDLFGPGSETDHIELPDPLVFETRGVGVKAGHIVDLTEHGPGQMAGITSRDQLICQSFRLESPAGENVALDRALEHGVPYHATHLKTGREAGLLKAGRETYRIEIGRQTERLRTKRKRYLVDDVLHRARHHRNPLPSFTIRRYDLQSRYCG